MPKPYPVSPDLHAAPMTKVIRSDRVNDIGFTLVQLQKSKTEVWHSLHVRPWTWTLSGIQTTDVLDYLGFRRSPACSFMGGECFARLVDANFDLQGFAQAFTGITADLQTAQGHLNACGIYLDEPQGIGFFSGKVTPQSRRRSARGDYRGDGHTASKQQRLKEAEDDTFSYVLSWIDGNGNKGWTTHYRPKHPPLSREMTAALSFLSLTRFEECPEFDFEPCSWRFTPFQPGQFGPIDSNSGNANATFDAHAQHFSAGIERLLAADLTARQFGMAILPGLADAQADVGKPRPDVQMAVSSPPLVTPQQSGEGARAYKYDVALSFAGVQRDIAEQLAQRIRAAGHSVFYDDFYPEQLWGKDLTVYFDTVFRKESKYCVIFVSADYAQRIWTSHEHQSARARALEQRDAEYILPIRVDATELPGLPPTTGYLSLNELSIEQIGDILLRKLDNGSRS